jgi:hypothetical protein
MLHAAASGVPHQIQVQPAGQASPSDHNSAVDAILAAATAALGAPGLTEADKLIVQQITSLGQKLKAQFEKEQQAALGGGPATQFMQRQQG